MTKPGYFPRETLDQLHGSALRDYGGMHGVHSDDAIESALARLENALAYGMPPPDIYEQAALLAEGIAKAHGYNDGNKRTGWLAAATYLDVHQAYFDRASFDPAQAMIDLVTGSISHTDLARLLRGSHTPQS